MYCYAPDGKGGTRWLYHTRGDQDHCAHVVGHYNNTAAYDMDYAGTYAKFSDALGQIVYRGWVDHAADNYMRARAYAYFCK